MSALIYRFPESAASAPDGGTVLDFGGRDPFAAGETLTEHGAIAFPQILPGAFSAAECAAITALGETRVKAAATVGGRTDLATRDYRVSEISWIEPAIDAHWLYHKLGLLFRNLGAGYGFELSGFVEPLQFTCYGPGQYFDWHVDIGGDATSLRKLSLTVQLSEAGAYAGGNLQFHGAADMPVARKQGAATCFPSYLAHQVSPVTAGLRRSLVAWAYGPAFR